MFEIDVLFCDCFGAYESKEEVAETWEQALGAFVIYVSDPDCQYCNVCNANYNKVLTYSKPMRYEEEDC